MKKYLIIIIWLLPIFASAQTTYPVDSLTHTVTYKEVVVIKGSKNNLFSKAKQWVITEFNSGKDVIQLDDATNGKIIVKGFFKANTLSGAEDGFKIYDNKVWFTITLDVKENKYRYIFNDFNFESAKTGGRVPIENMPKATSLREDISMKVNHNVQNLIKRLNTAMLNKDDF